MIGNSMKFQIITEELGAVESVATGHTHVATCTPPSWIYPGHIRILEDSRENAIKRVFDFLQKQVDALPPGRDMIEVDIIPTREKFQLKDQPIEHG